MGRIVLAASTSRAGDHGTARLERGLKHRAARETRTVLIPSDLVRLLRAHIKRYGTTLDGRVFQTERRHTPGFRLQRSLDRGPQAGLDPRLVQVAPWRRPYDLRHAAVSLWRNSGVPATEVASRAGHGVAVLLKIYAQGTDG